MVHLKVIKFLSNFIYCSGTWYWKSSSVGRRVGNTDLKELVNNDIGNVEVCHYGFFIDIS